MNNPAILMARPRKISAGGETHIVHPLTFSDYGDLQAWLDEQAPDPFAVAREQMASGAYTLAQQQFLMKTALELSCKPKPSLSSPDGGALLDSPGGRVEVLYLSVRKGEPTFTREDARRFLGLMNEAELAGVLDASEVTIAAGPKGETPGTMTLNPEPG